MGPGILTRYNASAGSGKTYKLTSIYLSSLFSSKNSYKKILAVTFTNKAASEMKHKILNQLAAIAEGRSGAMLEEIRETTGLPENEITSVAGEMLNSILHDYSNFHVGTIDSFFQKVLKAFTREIGLNHGYAIELDSSLILKKAVAAMISSASADPELREWIREYSYERAEGGKSWNLNQDIITLASEIFSEKFRLMPSAEKEKLKERSFLQEYLKELRSFQTTFSDTLKEYSTRCREILERHNVKDDMFLRGERGGVPSFLKTVSAGQAGIWKPANATVSQVLESPPVWTSKAGVSPHLKAAIDDGFGELFISTLRYYNENFSRSNTARFIADNIYILGIMSNILEQVHLITSSENRFLLSDAGELLWLIIRDDQTPFIYEKTGNAFENFMIDEFQDTSHIQWKNFRPLIENSMAEGNASLVVGDVKQSIYRWRNSDWRILNSVINEEIRKSGLLDEFLFTNWRSSSNIISFNNSLFSMLPAIICNATDNSDGHLILQELYKGAIQEDPGKKEGGAVRIEFIDEENDNFQESVLARLPGLIEELQDSGYSGSDIGILVRTNREGAAVLNSILKYRALANETKRKRYNYNVISSDSLLISAAPTVTFIITLLKSLYENDRGLSTSVMLRNWMILIGKDPLSTDLTNPEKEAERYFPSGFRPLMETVKGMLLFEAVETIIRFFDLGSKRGYTPYLNAFQDCVLEYSGSWSSDIPSFLEWWESTGAKRSIVISDQSDSMRVLTIHKAKGLEFKVVIIPFISWRMGHGSSGPTMWVKPESLPFSKLGTVPVKYKSDLQYSEFAGDYFNETDNVLIDNVNLLYVAFTRAIDRLYGFCPGKPKPGNIGSVLYQALSMDKNGSSGNQHQLYKYFDKGKGVFSFGTDVRKLPAKKEAGPGRINAGNYYVNNGIQHLHLKFHSENWLLASDKGRIARINHGLIMHEVLESVKTKDDMKTAIEKISLQGRITADEKKEIGEMLNKALENPEAAKWFLPGLKIMNEAEILLSDGSSRRPDRVIITDDKVIIVDFKSGMQEKTYMKQVSEYKKLLEEIEGKPAEAYLWYVDKNSIVKVQ